MTDKAALLARSIVAVEEMDRDGTLMTALEVLRHRQALADERIAIGVDPVPGPGPDTTTTGGAATGGCETKTFDNFVVTYGPENTRISLPGGVADLKVWGNQPCKLPKVGHFNQTYDQIIHNPEAIGWVKWVFDHHGNNNWKFELNDFAVFLIRTNLRFTNN